MGFIQNNVAWDDWRFCDPETYVSYWVDHIAEARQRPRAGWASQVEELVSAGVVSPGYRETLDSLPAHMDKLSPWPGMELVFIWSLEDARRQDNDDDEFVRAVAGRIHEVLSAIGDR
jgi:hypothetical protein